jgi:hypothetical protein
MRFSFLLIFALPIYGFAQTTQNVEQEKPETISRHIFRIVGTQPIAPEFEGNVIVTAQYERALANKLSLVGKAGLGFSEDNFGDDGTWRSAYFIFTVLEGRYYYSQSRRIKKGRPVNNHTGPYMGIDITGMSNPVFYASNGPGPRKPFAAGLASYLNIGYQKQVKKWYINGSLGALLKGTRYTDYVDARYAASFHGGVSVGFVF